MSIKFFLKTSNGQQVTAKCMLALGLGWVTAAPLWGQQHQLSDYTPATAAPVQPAAPFQSPGLQLRAQLEGELQPGEQLIAPGLPKAPTPPPPSIVAGGSGVPGGYFTNGNAIIADPNVMQGHHAALGYQAVGSHHGGHQHNGSGPYGGNLCEVNCHDGYVATAEALWIMREGQDNFSLSREFALGGFNHEIGTRFTFGSKWNCTDGWEIGFVSPIDWTSTGSRAVTVANPDSALFTSGGFAASELDPFNDALNHSQTYRTEYQAFEINKKSWAWDIFSVVYGVRFMDIEEDLTFSSQGVGGNNGLFIQQTDNALIGVHVGGDWMFPMSQRLMVGQRGRLGVAANFYDGATFVSNGAGTLVNRGNDDEVLACFVEWGIVARYRLYRSLYLTTGYEFWYVDGVALASDQPITNINPATGNVYFANDELFFHGGSFGFEILF